jgi:hypothetical protein
MKKALLIIVAVLGILLVGFYALNAYIYKEKQGTGETYEPYQATLTGEFVCLPHADTSGPQTMECAFGLKTDVGEYFAVDLSMMSPTQRQPETGERFTASGTVTPIDRLSTDHWQKYGWRRRNVES